MTKRAAAPAVTFAVLGPVEAYTDRGPVPLKGSRQRAVLARLLIARGRVVPVDRLANDLWEVPPDGAVAALRTFVADLRRALEPDRPPRQPARLLLTVPPGYALRVEPDAVDAWRFESAVNESEPLLRAGRADQALAGLDDALGRWRGPAYAQFAVEGWARAEIDRLDEVRMLAVERRAEALLELGRAAEAASGLRAYVADHPLREDAWQLLATSLYRSGRQGDALAALRRARETLVAELGVDPGPRLRQLEADILAQAPHLNPPPRPGPPAPPPVTERPGAAREDFGVVTEGSAGLGAVTGAAEAATEAPGAVRAGDGRRPFVGRDEELAGLRRAAEAVVRHRRPALALVSGDAGAGKTALAEALTQRLSAEGWTVAWGRSPEYEGAPVAWPWIQITEAFAASAAGPGQVRSAEADDTDVGFAEDPAVARFRLHRAAVSQLAAVARRGPVLLVVDDLHRADEDTLDLLTALVAAPEPVSGPVLIVGTYRATEITATLTAALARFARIEPARVYLGGLSEAATGALAGAVADRELDAPTVGLIHRRTGGNPFFIRELARLLATEGDAALAMVPAGVRDVIRHRLTRLPDAAQTVLRQAAVLGRDVDSDVLAALTGDEPAVLDALDRAVRAGFLSERVVDPRLRFTHILVRDTLYGDLSAPRRAHWHTVIAEAIERLYPRDAAALAYHFTNAASRATAPRAAHYAQIAARQAERRSNPHEAGRLWRQALAGHDRAGGGDIPGRLAAVMGLGRALAVTGHLDEARRHRSAAIAAAVELDDSAVTASVLAAFDVPAIWTRNDDEHLSRRIVRVAEHALASLPADRREQRSRLLSTLALELRGTTGDRGRRAAHEAEAIAREVDSPALLAFALNARFMHAFHRTGLARERADIGTELVDLAARHDLVTFQVLGHLILLQAHCALADFAAADAHATAADRLAERYDLPVVGVFTQWYAALRLAVDGKPTEAEIAYRAAYARLARNGMPGMDQGLLALALLSLRLLEQGPGEQLDPASIGPLDRGSANADWGPYEPWVRPLILLSTGRRDEAATALRTLPESPHDLLREARACLTARAALALNDHATIDRVRTELLPAADELAGAGSGVLTLGPVAQYLNALTATQRGA